MSTGGFSMKYNTDDVFLRAVIVGFLGVLDKKIVYKQQISETEVKYIEVPFRYNNSGDSRFMQDFFLFNNDCNTLVVDTNYDIIPRGMINLESFNIDSGNLTNKWVRGTYTKESAEGNLETYSAMINPVPMSISFSCSLVVDSLIDSFKIVQEIIKQLYKTKIFHITYNGFRIGCRAKFSEDNKINKTFEYDYGSETNATIEFNIEVESYLPVVDESTERHNSNRISEFSPNLGMANFDGTSNASPVINTDYFSPYGYNIDGDPKK